MAFFDKLNDLAKNIGEKTSEAIETGKLNNKINAARNAAGEHMKKIGELYYGKYAAGEAVDPAILEYCAAIDAQNQLAAEAHAEQATAYPEQAKRLELLRLEIEAAQRTLSTLQAEKAQQEAKEQAERAAREAAEAAFTCPNCGMVNKEGTKFCQECGTKLSGQTKAFCTACGAELPPGTRFCGECGARQAE